MATCPTFVNRNAGGNKQVSPTHTRTQKHLGRLWVCTSHRILYSSWCHSDVTSQRSPGSQSFMTRVSPGRVALPVLEGGPLPGQTGWPMNLVGWHCVQIDNAFKRRQTQGHDFAVSWRAVWVHRCFDYRSPAPRVGAATLVYQAVGVSVVQCRWLGGACIHLVPMPPRSKEARDCNSHRVIAIRP